MPFYICGMRDLNPRKPLGRGFWYKATLIPHYSDGTGIWIQVKQATTARNHQAILYRHFIVPPTWFEHVLKRSTASCFTRLSYGGLFIFLYSRKDSNFRFRVQGSECLASTLREYYMSVFGMLSSQTLPLIVSKRLIHYVYKHFLFFIQFSIN